MNESSEKANNVGETKPTSNESTAIQISLVPYWFLAFLRVILTLLPQIGYIHPDEYFQSVEVLSGDILGVASTRPWEFNSTFPLRSVTIPYIVVGFPLYILRSISPFVYLWFDLHAITPYTLLIAPRLACCLLSFIVDYCLFRICWMYGQNYRPRLLTLASSYVILIYGCRTFTNTFEMVLTSMLIYLVAGCMARSDQIIFQDEFLRERYNSADNIKDRVRLHRLRLSLPWHTFSNVFPIATVTVLGIFNRPTFLAYAFPPVFFWLHRGLGSRFIGLNDFNMRMIAFCICALPALFTLIIIDSMYYGYLTVEELTQKNISVLMDFVMTPYNFVKYNVNNSNLAEHGLHPRYTHTLINIPLLFNVLGISGLLSFFHFIYRGLMKRWSTLPRVQSIIGLMTTSFIIPIAILSIFPHQEARFLIPCTLPLVFLHSQRIRHVTEQKSVISRQENGYIAYIKNHRKFSFKDGTLTIWYLINIIMTLFFGFMHQAGVYPLIKHFSEEMNSKPRLTMIHVVTSHMYPLPISLLQLKYGRAQYSTHTGTRFQRIQDFYTYELGSSDMDAAALKLSSVIEQAEKTWSEKRLKYRVYFVVPSSLAYDFQAAALKLNLTQNVVTTFFPHVSTEALPYVDLNLRLDCQSLHFMDSCPADIPATPWTLDLPLKYVLHIAHQFGLTLFSVKK